VESVSAWIKQYPFTLNSAKRCSVSNKAACEVIWPIEQWSLVSSFAIATVQS
jgi:hypothetical protein